MRGLRIVPGAGYLAATCFTALALLLRWLLDPWLGETLPLTTLYAAVAASAWVGGSRPAVLAAILGYLACEWLFVAPRSPVAMTGPGQAIGLGLYLLACAVLIGFGEAVRAAWRLARRNEELVARTLESITDGLVTLDRDWRCTSVNAEAERLLGLPRQKLVGAVLWEAFPDAVGTELDRQLRRAAAEQAPCEFEVFRPGTGRWYESKAYPTPEGGVTVFFHDVTARKQAEGRLAAVLASIDDHLVCYDAQWRYTYVNDHAARMLGKSQQELLGRCIWDVFPEAVGNQYYRELHQAARERRAVRSEHYYAPFGRWFENHIYPTAEGVTVFASDVTDRKRAEEEARSARELLRLIADNLPPLISYIDKDYRYRLNNRAYEVWFGRPSEQMHGQHVRDVLGEAVWEKIRPRMEAALAGRVVLYEEEMPYKDGPKRWVEASYVPHLGPGGEVEGFAVLVSDISARRRDAEELRRLNADLSDAHRRKDEFLATLAHELRNPLAPIRNAVEILRLTEPAGPESGGVRDIIDRQVRQMTRLVDDLLDVSRITRGKVQLRRERLDLASPLRDAVEAARPLLEASGHRLTLALPPAPVWLDADPTRLTQIFLNLLTNAAKFTPAGGQVWLTATRRGREAVVSVRDSGVGIAAEHMPRLFQMFSQVAPALERSHGGLGIGLALARGLAELHGGSVEARSDGQGQGSEFTVRLPVAEPAPAPPAAAEPARGAAKRRILLVEDNLDSARTLAMMLRLMGHEVHTAHDGAEAVLAAEAVRPEVVLLDIGLPKMNGYEAARHIRREPWGRGMTLIALTGWGQEEDKRRAAEAGFDRHLTKPVDPASLEAALRV